MQLDQTRMSASFAAFSCRSRNRLGIRDFLVTITHGFLFFLAFLSPMNEAINLGRGTRSVIFSDTSCFKIAL